jgi:hypothetical protein
MIGHTKVANYLHSAGAAQKDNRPWLLEEECPHGLRVIALPEVRIGDVDHSKYELVHVFRKAKTATVSELRDGRYYSIAPYGPSSDFLTVLQWEKRDPSQCHVCTWEGCRACRLEHRGCGGCHCKGDTQLNHKVKEVVVTVGPNDRVHVSGAPGKERTITIKRGDSTSF